MIADHSALGGEEVDDPERRALAGVVDVLLVGDTEHQHAAAVERLPAAVEGPDHLGHAERGHLRVDLPGELDELGVEVELARLPGQVEGVDRDAVPAEAGARAEGHVAERLRGGGVDDVPDVDRHPVAQHRQLVDERDVDAAEDVLEQLGHLGDLRRGDLDDRVHGEPVDLGRAARALGGQPADDLRRRARRPVDAAGVDPLRREGQREVAARPQPRALEDRGQLVARRPGVGRALEDDQLALAQPLGEALGGAEHRGQVGFAVLVQRRRQADQHRVDLPDLIPVGRRADQAGGGQGAQAVARDVLDVRPAGVDLVDLGLDRIEAEDRDSRLGERRRQRKPDVAQTDDPDPGRRRAQ